MGQFVFYVVVRIISWEKYGKERSMVLWWSKIFAVAGCLIVFFLSAGGAVYIGDETDSLAIFFFFLAFVAAGICCLVCQIEPSLPVQPQPQQRVEIVRESPVQPRPVQRPPQKVEVVDREVLPPKRPRPIPVNFKK